MNEITVLLDKKDNKYYIYDSFGIKIDRRGYSTESCARNAYDYYTSDSCKKKQEKSKLIKEMLNAFEEDSNLFEFVDNFAYQVNSGFYEGLDSFDSNSLLTFLDMYKAQYSNVESYILYEAYLRYKNKRK